MRVLFLALTVSVAACQMDAPPADAPDVTAAPPPAAPPAPQAPAPQAPAPPAAPQPTPEVDGPAVPTAYQGTWDVSVEACASPVSPARWEVGPLRMSGLSGYAEVMTAAETGRRVALETLFFSEAAPNADPQPVGYVLELVGPGADALSVTAAGQTDAKVRCP